MQTKETPTIKIGKVVNTDSIEFKQQQPRGSCYDTVFDKMEQLKAGQSFTVDIPEGVAPRTMHNRINAAMRRVEIKCAKGCIFVKRTTEENKIAISCEKA